MKTIIRDIVLIICIIHILLGCCLTIVGATACLAMIGFAKVDGAASVTLMGVIITAIGSTALINLYPR